MNLHLSLVLYFLVTDLFSKNLSGPILNLLSIAASTATAARKLWKFRDQYAKCFLLSALTQFDVDFHKSPHS